MNPVILAIESSCDETAVALVDDHGRILSERLASQILTHRLYGGVVPEVASRGHFETLDALVKEVLRESGLAPQALHAVAATSGPGLVGPLLVGFCYGEGLARGAGRPFIGVHHLRGHLASTLLSAEPDPALSLPQKAASLFPALTLLVSGGHTQILEVGPSLKARKWADTADDAAGECFDKSAKLMGLPYPGGPEIERLAAQLAPDRLNRAQELKEELPHPRSSEGFSFSGLKTAIRLKLERDPSLAKAPEFAWAIQETVAEVLRKGLDKALDSVEGTPKSFVLCGGVAANARIRETLTKWSVKRGLKPYFPPLKHATDNAAMIGAAAWVQDPSLRLNEVAARISLEIA